MKHKLVVIRCQATDCGAIYQVKNRVWAIEFAICPQGHPKNPVTYARYLHEKKCAECGVPKSLSTGRRFVKGNCFACYRANEREEIVNKTEVFC